MSGEVTRIAVAVVERAGEYLIGRRPPDVPLGGYWEFPGGKIHADETPAAAAVRECWEETGLAVQVSSEYPAELHDYDYGRLELRFFACQLVDAAVEPRAPFRWVPRGELSRYQFPDANRQLIERLVTSTGNAAR
ncbi:MAG: (deoxy)nucleoside triphosphate pyrophosphohydrolase [Pirellulales bacterium]|nr:(deoxy)nucleoside triphosphate pyrophosphohydrolase [Pirellulales bacterium]